MGSDGGHVPYDDPYLDLKLVLDAGFLDNLMAKDDSRRNHALLDIAADVLGRPADDPAGPRSAISG